MSETSQPVPPARNKQFGGGVRVLLYACLIAAVLYVGNYAFDYYKTTQALQTTFESTVATSGLIAPAPKSLAPKFTDSKGRLLADPPASSDQLADPDTLVVAHINGTDESPGTSW